MRDYWLFIDKYWTFQEVDDLNVSLGDFIYLEHITLKVIKQTNGKTQHHIYLAASIRAWAVLHDCSICKQIPHIYLCAPCQTASQTPHLIWVIDCHIKTMPICHTYLLVNHTLMDTTYIKL